ncbi:MAG: hypothetical protein JST35_00725 [Armatimonadetes bacterium]|jgi:division/cell wall cluster transcriptional repressor MraZ|nr:hypothetical protein [Armatimonadota bacterium]
MATKDKSIENKPWLFAREDVTIDDRGRISVKPRYRQFLGEEIVLRLHPMGYVEVLKLADFEEQVRRIQALDQMDPDVQLYRKLVFNYTYSEEGWDNQGRLVIPRPLREAAGLKRDVILIGENMNVEVWSAELRHQFDFKNDTFDMSRTKLYGELYQRIRQNGGQL